MKLIPAIRNSILISLLLLSISNFAQEADTVGYIVKDGELAPDFSMTYSDGTTLKLSDLRGQIVMLQFTASWCSVCRKEMPHIEKEIWQVYKDKGLIVIGIDRDEPLEVVQEFAKKMNISYPLALDPNADIFALFALKQSGVTRNVLIDRSGKIVLKTRLFDKKEFNKLINKIKKLVEEV